MASVTDSNVDIIEEFRANEGKIGGDFAGGTFVVLHTIGAKTGKERLTPLAYLPHNGRLYVFAVGPGEVGAPTHPAWYHNLVAHPDVTVEVGSETAGARATVVQGPERTKTWAAMIMHNPHFGAYRNNHVREIPVIALDPKPQR